jgi:S-methylmethionine-dependent homocysteine/selenocysteine methylase
MAKYRNALPQLGGGMFVTDGGLETTLVFVDGIELPHFSAIHAQRSADGQAALRRYFRSYADIARDHDAGLILETATWRASRDWGIRLGCSPEELQEANRQAVRMIEEVRDEYETEQMPVVISGCVGPRGDGYIPEDMMNAERAAEYHADQVRTFADAGADLVTAITMNYVHEALGIAEAARQAGIPVAIAFTVETDGKLPTGQSLQMAIEQVDAETSGYPAYYMINCAHPDHFLHVVAGSAPWTRRLRGLRANASRRSHAELNEATELDSGDPEELGRQYAELKGMLPQLNIMGGCCGTDHRHVEQMAAACRPLFQ